MEISKREFGDSIVEDMVDVIKKHFETWDQLLGNYDVDVPRVNELNAVDLVHGCIVSAFILHMEDVLRTSEFMSTSEWDAIHMACAFAGIDPEKHKPIDAETNRVYLAMEIVYSVTLGVSSMAKEYSDRFHQHIEHRRSQL